MDKNEIWNLTLQELEVTLSQANFTTWFRDTFISSVSEEEVTVGVPSNFTKEWLENKYKTEIFEALKKSITSLKKIEFVIISKKEMGGREEALSQKTIPEPMVVEIKEGGERTVSRDHTFKNYIVGESNKLAHAASIAVAKKPGTAYNPLFLYGGVGLGKTHLMHAICNEIERRNPQKKVLYIPCEQFANEFIKDVRSGEMERFKKRYREVDALLVDDIHFLTGKEVTQEEFFHTFNALHSRGKQVVISSDRPPKDIELLEQRLRSRFEWGMIADIGRPDFETRLAIILNKAKEKNTTLDKEVAEFLAVSIQDNIRELEGALNKLTALSDLSGEKPNLSLAKKVLESFKTVQKAAASPDKTLNEVSNFYQMKKEELLSIKRNKEIALPRQIAMYLLRHELNLSFPKIAEFLRKKDHTTIMHGCQKIEKLLQSDESLQKEVSLIKEKIYA